MEHEEIDDVVKAAELKAPILKPVTHLAGDHCVCCMENVKMPKRKICGPPNVMPMHSINCLCRGIRRPYRPPPKPINERDILFRPVRWRCREAKKMIPHRSEPSLGSPIGLTQSSFSLSFLENKKDALPLVSFAATLVAFAEYYITPEFEWDEKVLNRVLFEGHCLYTTSMNELGEGDTLNEAKIKRTFMLCDNAFDIKVHEPFLMGRVRGENLPIPNLHWSLGKFFKKNQFCLLQVDQKYFLIWKNLQVYFVFDGFGRRAQDFRTDRKLGTGMLICLRDLDNVSHLVHNLSDVEADQLFSLRELQIKSLVPCGGKPTPEIVDRKMQFEIESPEYAILRASVHLGSHCFKEVRNRQSLPIAIVALVNSKIDAPPTWDSSVMDKIVKLGARYYKRWTQCDISLDLGIQDIPNRFAFGQFMVQIAVNAVAECGFWKCTPNFRTSELSQAIRAAFERGSNLLLQIQGRSYAIWKKGTFYYVLDPYCHQCALGRSKLLTASLRMCGTIEKLCCVVTQALLELFEKSKFVIHLVKIVKIEEFEKMKEESDRRLEGLCMCIATPHTDEVEETKSLNASVEGASEYECMDATVMPDYDSGDLDSPGLSQTRLEDYADFRKDFVDSDEEEDEGDDDQVLDLDAEPSDMNRGPDTSDDEGAEGTRSAKKKRGSKSGDGKGRGGGGKKEKPPRKEKEGTGVSDKEAKKSRKGDKGDASGDADDEMEGKNKKKEDEKPVEEKNENENKDKEKHGKKRKNEDEEPKPEEKPEKKKKTEKKEDEDKKTEKTDKAEKKEKPEKTDKEKQNDMQKEKDATKKKGDVDMQKEKDATKKKGDIDMPKTEPTDQDAPTEAKSRGDAPDKDATSKPATEPRRQKHQRRKQQDGDDTSSDEIPRGGIPAGCKPNSYPGFTEDPQDLAVVGSESGSYESLCCLLKSAFRCADRVLTMTPWGNYVAFRANRAYFIFDGCTCNLRSIRHMDLNVGTAGLLCFPDMHSLITYIENGKEVTKPTVSPNKDLIDRICSEYCGDKC